MDIIQILLSIVAGAVAGGITAKVVCKRYFGSQKSSGNSSPNIVGDSNRING